MAETKHGQCVWLLVEWAIWILQWVLGRLIGLTECDFCIGLHQKLYIDIPSQHFEKQKICRNFTAIKKKKSSGKLDCTVSTEPKRRTIYFKDIYCQKLVPIHIKNQVVW